MDHFLNRYRNLGVLLVAVLVQLVLLAYQVRNDKEIRLIRVWSVGAVTPVARVLETIRSSTANFFGSYVVVRDAREENKRLQHELDEARMENAQLRTELDTAGRAQALTVFQAQTKMKTVAARVIGNTTGSSTVMIVDRGASDGILPGMAVITPAGIAGKVTKVFPGTSFVLLITDPYFAAGVISQKHRVLGTLQGGSTLTVQNVPNEQMVEQGEKFFTAGNEGIFPRGYPVGTASAVREGRGTKQIVIAPSGFDHGLEDVMIITEGVHAAIPEEAVDVPMVLMPPAPPDPGTLNPLHPAATGPMSTEADRITDYYRELGKQAGYDYGRGGPEPNFNRPLAPVGTTPQKSEKGTKK